MRVINLVLTRMSALPVCRSTNNPFQRIHHYKSIKIHSGPELAYISVILMLHLRQLSSALYIFSNLQLELSISAVMNQDGGLKL